MKMIGRWRLGPGLIPNFRYLGPLTFLLICLVLFTPSRVSLATQYNDFADPAVWTPQVYGIGPELVNNANGFSALIPGSSAPSGSGAQPDLMSAGYASTFFLHGDFAVDAPYALTEWPIGNGVRLGVAIGPWYGNERVSQVMLGSPAGEEAYVFVAGEIKGIIATADRSGTLRLVRRGSTLSGYYLTQSGDWILIGNGAVSTGDVTLSLGAWTDNSFFGHQSVRVDFTNVEVVSQPIVCDAQLNQTSYATGDNVTVTTFRVTNQGSKPVPIEFKVWFASPGTAPASVGNTGANGSLVLPPGYSQELGPISLGPVQDATPRGTYEFSCRILDPTTGQPLTEDLNTFTIH